MEYRWGNKQLSQQRGYCYLVLFKQETWNTKSWPAHPTFSDIVTWPREWREERAWVNITLHDKKWKKERFWLGHVEKVWEHEEDTTGQQSKESHKEIITTPGWVLIPTQDLIFPGILHDDNYQQYSAYMTGT